MDRGHPYELPDLWLPNSPDFNPVDYKILDNESSGLTKAQNVNELKRRLTDV